MLRPTVGKSGDGDGSNRSFMFSCYYDNSLFKQTSVTAEAGKNGFPLSSGMLRSRMYVDGTTTFEFDTSGKYQPATTGQTIKEVLQELINGAEDVVDGPYQVGTTDDEIIAGLMHALITHDKEQTDINKMLTFKLYEYHFSLNEALHVFRLWTQSMPDNENVTTNCHTFTAAQIAFLKAHYDGSHIYKYIPATYPKTQ